ncbi:hypothetical protein [Promineifilum sp.]|uniref:hypothetical protein n=1 Tax=Promineifilum sp. TaxID=2664178 RepID=UPI0035B1F062
MRRIFRNDQGEWNTQVVIALIGAAATLLTAVIAGVFGLIQLRAADAPPAEGTPAPALAVTIEGPAEAPLNQVTALTIISENATRAEWSIAGFGSDDINPFHLSDQVEVEPTNAERVGEWFTLVVTVYDSGGAQASARHRFQVVEGE